MGLIAKIKRATVRTAFTREFAIAYREAVGVQNNEAPAPEDAPPVDAPARDWRLTRALAHQCTVAADRQVLLRASAALGQVIVSNGGRVLPNEPAAAAVPAAPAAPAAAAAGEGQGGPLRWVLAALGGGVD